MREMLELMEAIELQRSRLDAIIWHGMTDEEVIRTNREMDLLIEEYIALEKKLASEKEG